MNHPSLWTALHLHHLPLEIFTPAAPGEARVVSSGGPRPRVVAANAAARSLGVAPGMALAAAQALAPGLASRLRDPAGEGAALERLAAWAQQFTPAVSLSPPDTLLLEIGGCLRLFGGLGRLLAQLKLGLAELGFSASCAGAPTPRAAELLVWGGQEVFVQRPAALPALLRPLALDGLALPSAARAALHDAGIDDFGACLALPRDGLARRFGQALLDDLDRALGRLPDPRAEFVAPAAYSGRLELAAPVAEAEALLFAARRLLAEMGGWLAARGLGVMQFELRLGHHGPGFTLCPFRLSTPTREVEALQRIVRERLARLPLSQRVEWVGLYSVETGAYQAREASLWGGDTAMPEAAAALVDRLRARLGEEAVVTLRTIADHRPEQASHVASSSTPAAREAPPLPEAPRPLWLVAEPEACELAGCTWLDGPERLESGWWDGGDARRDYFVVRTRRGEAWWVYRELGRDGWFRAGIYA